MMEGEEGGEEPGKGEEGMGGRETGEGEERREKGNGEEGGEKEESKGGGGEREDGRRPRVAGRNTKRECHHL